MSRDATAPRPSEPGRSGRAGAPEPEPVRWFGTGWVERGPGYRLRRVLVPLGALAATAAAVLLLDLAVAGVGLSASGGALRALLLAAVGLSTVLSGLRTWKLLSAGRDALTGWMAEDRQLGVVWVIGGAGALFAYFLRSLVEAPGEAVARARYRAALERHGRRRTARSGRPDRR